MDEINGAFEFAGSLFLAMNVRALLRDKEVKGVHWCPVAFFFAWGLWNLVYYPSLGQWWSFAGGCAIASANVTWLALMIYYRRSNGR